MAEKEEAELTPGETVPGGQYIRGEQVVNAEGEVIEGLTVKDGKIVGKAKDADEKKK